MNTEVRQNYYDILDLKETASVQEIRAAYDKAKATYSVDNKALLDMFSPEETHQLRQMIEEAYKVLSNDDFRNVYERRMAAAEEYSQADLTAEAIKTAAENLFERAQPPTVVLDEVKIAKPMTAQNAPSVDPAFEASLINKKDWAGEDLKRVREYRGLSYDELTDITKINPWYIAAIEKMDPSNLPVEVFVRGYVLQVAKALGLKEKVVTESYMRLFRKQLEK